MLLLSLPYNLLHLLSALQFYYIVIFFHLLYTGNMTMKKKIFALFLTFVVLSFGFTQNDEKKSDEQKTSEEVWQEIGEQGKNALIETGKFFKSAGEAIGNQVLDALKSIPPQNCVGVWTYNGKSVKTTLSCNEDGTMEINQKSGFDTDYWKGVYTSNLNTITFSVKEKGHKAFISKKTETLDENWLILFLVLDDGQKLKITSTNIPADKDGTKYSGIVFEKQ